MTRSAEHPARRNPARLSPAARSYVESLRALADQAFSRAAGAPLIPGNRIRLLRDATENYPAWLEAIAGAQRYIHFECYIIHDDAVGERLAAALLARAAQGVAVRVLYDWLGGLGKASRGFWSRLRAGGVEVRCYNPPRLDSPLGWLSRDHRKMVAVDGEVAFVHGLCVGRMWAGEPEKGREPWRDTGVEIRGPAVADVERAFAQLWDTLGEPIADPGPAGPAAGGTPAGSISVRIVATVPVTGGLMRLDQLVTALARERVWLTDAYYAGTATYVQALSAAARSGVDVRLLLPNSTDIPLLSPLSRAGYRPLLEAGVRVFEWNGTMLHAKTAVADGRWARVGSSNLNLASWMGNYELDVVIEDEAFGRRMEEMYLQDLDNATEIVLAHGRFARTPAAATAPVPPRRHPRLGSGRGSAGRAAAGAIRMGNAIGAAFTGRRVLEPTEMRLMISAGLGFLGAALLFGVFPRALAYPLVVILAWLGLSLLNRARELRRERAAAQAENASSRPR